MRIGFDAKRAFNNGSGLGNYSRFIINGLATKFPEHDYSLFTPSISPNINYVPPTGCQTILPGHFWQRIFKSYWRSVSLGKHLRRNRIDLFHGLSNELPVNIGTSGLKSVVTIHDLIFLTMPELYKSLDRKVYLRKTKHAIENAHRIIAISSHTKKDLVEKLGADENKIRVVYQGCHSWFYDQLTAEEKQDARKQFNLPDKYLLYVGTIEKRKNLLEIIGAIHQAKLDIPLVVVGRKTPYFNDIEDYISKNNMRNILFYDYVASKDLPKFYQCAETFIYPSSYEGFGIPVIEALNSGIPVITSRGGCLEETAGKHQLLVDPGNTEELGDAILRSLEDRSLRDRMIREGKRHVQSFREEKTIPSLYKVYEECMN